MTQPQLPREVSPDGREIWAWGAKLSEHVHRQARIRELARDIVDAPRRCGSCVHWMGDCPREVRGGMSGRPTGPSMNALVCGKFTIKPSTAEWIAKIQAELETLQAEHSP